MYQLVVIWVSVYVKRTFFFVINMPIEKKKKTFCALGSLLLQIIRNDLIHNNKYSGQDPQRLTCKKVHCIACESIIGHVVKGPCDMCMPNIKSLPLRPKKNNMCLWSARASVPTRCTSIFFFFNLINEGF